jgi:hypothetical protein
VDDGVVVAGSTVLTSASATFISADIGKPIDVIGAGPSINGKNDQLRTTILGVQDAQTAILGTPAQVDISNAHVSWGTDEQPPLQAAINAAAAGGGTVYVPTGCYRISELLTITASDIRLTGDGDASEIYMSHVHTFAEGGEQANQGDGLPNLYIGSAGRVISNIEVDHLKFANAGVTILNSVNGAGLITVVDGSTVNSYKLYDLTIQTSSRCGITQAATSRGFEIYNNTISGGLHGFYIAGFGTNGYVHDNHLTNTPALWNQYNSAGMAIKGQTNGKFVRNTVDGYRYGLLVSDHLSQGLTIDSNVLTNSHLALAINWGVDLSLTNNTIDTANSTGIWIQSVASVNQVRILGNSIRNVNGYGIYLVTGTGTISDIDIEGNVLTSCMSGLQFYLVRGTNSIINNVVQAPGAKLGVSFSVVPFSGAQTLFTSNVSEGYNSSNIAPGVNQQNNSLH